MSVLGLVCFETISRPNCKVLCIFVAQNKIPEGEMCFPSRPQLRIFMTATKRLICAIGPSRLSQWVLTSRRSLKNKKNRHTEHRIFQTGGASKARGIFSLSFRFKTSVYYFFPKSWVVGNRDNTTDEISKILSFLFFHASAATKQIRTCLRQWWLPPSQPSSPTKVVLPTLEREISA